MFICGHPYYEDFMQIYRIYHLDYPINESALDFYLLRRKLEDIWAFTEEIIYDRAGEEEMERNLYFLRKICATLTDNTRKF